MHTMALDKLDCQGKKRDYAKWKDVSGQDSRVVLCWLQQSRFGNVYGL